MMISISIFL